MPDIIDDGQSPGTPDWQIIEPGLIELATTHIRIRYTPSGAVPFRVEREGATLGIAPTLQQAKERAMSALNELLQMGIDP